MLRFIPLLVSLSAFLLPDSEAFVAPRPVIVSWIGGNFVRRVYTLHVDGGTSPWVPWFPRRSKKMTQLSDSVFLCIRYPSLLSNPHAFVEAGAESVLHGSKSSIAQIPRRTTATISAADSNGHRCCIAGRCLAQKPFCASPTYPPLHP